METLSILIGLAIGYGLHLWYKDYRENKKQDAYFEEQKRMYADPDYWKEDTVIEGWDRDIVYNKFGVHIMDKLGGDKQRLWQAEHEVERND